MRQIKILHLLTSMAPGGAETNLLALMRHFDHNRYKHAIAYGGSGALEKEFSQTGAELIPLAKAPLSFRSLLSTPAMLKRIETYSPNIIHSHLDLPNLLGLVAKRYLKCRLILHLHGLGIVPRHMLHEREMTHLIWNFVGRAYKNCDRAIAICGYQLPYLEKFGIRTTCLS